MNGPEHWREAEKILALHPSVLDGEGAEMTAVFTMAQVHATLAVAAAAVTGAAMRPEDRDSWDAVIWPDLAREAAAAAGSPEPAESPLARLFRETAPATAHDADRQVEAVMTEAVLDVLAPKAGNTGFGDTAFGQQRWPVFRFDYEGRLIIPNDDQLRSLAGQIVTAIRTATGGAP